MSNGSAEERIMVEERAARIRLLLFDVDGVLTDGVVIMHADGTESKGFHIRDGAALVWAQRSGVPVGLLSSRASGAPTWSFAPCWDAPVSRRRRPMPRQRCVRPCTGWANRPAGAGGSAGSSRWACARSTGGAA